MCVCVSGGWGGRGIPHGPCDLLPGDGLEQVTSVHELGDEKHLVVFYTRTLLTTDTGHSGVTTRI